MTTDAGLADHAARQRALEVLEGHMRLVACAGSGKTETVARRICEMLTRGGVVPANIAAFTFTEMAAAELKDRIATRFFEQTGSKEGLADLYVGTIHAFCLGLLQQHDFSMLSYRVLTDVQQRLLISRNSRKCGLADLQTKTGKQWHRYHQAGTFAETMAILREADIDEQVLVGSDIEHVLRKYENLLEEHRFFDYTSILSRTVELLEQDRVFALRATDQLRYVTVDEYQDVNPVQERLLAMLAAEGVDVCVVGDDDQLLYDWRGSRMANMVEFTERYQRVEELTLEQNFRSSRGIVDLAAHVIDRNRERIRKRMRSAGNQSYEEGDIQMVEFASAEQEAAYIAAEVRDLIGRPFADDPKSARKRGLAYSDCAILVRVKRLIPQIVAALDAADIPYVVGGVANLFHTPEACAARTLFDHLAGEATSRELAEAWRRLDIGIDDENLAAGVAYAEQTYAEKSAGEERFGFYNLQRAFLGFLEHVRLREEQIDGPDEHGYSRGEVIYYNLGKFSQVISDFEQIYFQTDPQQKYTAFAGFLRHQAAEIYPEGWLESRYVTPNAVQVMTIHQAKGLQWPAVFVPGMTRGRFPARRAGGVQPWSVIPDGAVRNKDDYKTTEEDERRLFYVACTRAKKFLRLTRGVYLTEKSSWHEPSPFWQEAEEALEAIDPHEPRRSSRRLKPQPRRQLAEVALSFSELKYAFECPYEFKLRFMYGFNPPIHEALGQGKGLHDCLFELHDMALCGEEITIDCVDELVDRHLHLPFAFPELRENLEKSARQHLREYIEHRSGSFEEIEHAERPIEIYAGDGIRVSGRVDLIRRRDTDEVVIVDFKSSDRTQAEEVTDLQLHVYALGYEQTEDEEVSAVVVTNLDELDADRVMPVTDRSLADAERAVRRVAGLLRSNDLPKDPRGHTEQEARATCEGCDLQVLCRDVD